MGLKLIELFVVDLLGFDTAQARVFMNKFGLDYEETFVVSVRSKVLAGSFIVAVDAFFIYYTLLKAYRKGQHWQHNFLLACLAQVVVEVVLNETLECAWLNYFVPTLVSDEVKRATAVLKRAAEELTEESRSANVKGLPESCRRSHP